MSQFRCAGSVESVQKNRSYSLPDGDPVASLRSVFSQRSTDRSLPSALGSARPAAVNVNVIVPLPASPFTATLVMSAAPAASPVGSGNVTVLGPLAAAPARLLSASAATVVANSMITLLITPNLAF